MKMIVGLGNPGRQYDGTRHNAGFFVLEILEDKLKLNFKEEKRHKAMIATYKKDDETYLFVKPLTFMNLSGEAVYSIANYYHIDSDDMLVIHDDLDLPVGKLRLRTSGSSGGQKGMKNIMDLLKTQNLKRIRIGISNNKAIENYVLTKVTGDEYKDYKDACERASEAVIMSFDSPFERVMNKYNG